MDITTMKKNHISSLDFECPNFMIFDATVSSQCYKYIKKKNILQGWI